MLFWLISNHHLWTSRITEKTRQVNGREFLISTTNYACSGQELNPDLVQERRLTPWTTARSFSFWLRMWMEFHLKYSSNGSIHTNISVVSTRLISVSLPPSVLTRFWRITSSHEPRGRSSIVSSAVREQTTTTWHSFILPLSLSLELRSSETEMLL
jgi:hypothetical protein